MIAALKRQSECLELLLKSGAIANTRNVSGCTALHLAERMSDDQYVKLLLESGADMNIRQNNAATPFDY